MKSCKFCGVVLVRKDGLNGEKYEGPSQFQRRKYCNDQCYFANQKAINEAKKHLCPCGCAQRVPPSRKYYNPSCTGRILRERALEQRRQCKPQSCMICQKPMQIRTNESINEFQKKKTCGSRVCQAKYVWRYSRGRKKHKCEGCGKKFFMAKRQRFHDQECFRHSQKVNSLVTLTCTGCGIPFERSKSYASGSGRAFHSRDCWAANTKVITKKSQHAVSEEEQKAILLSYASTGVITRTSQQLQIPYSRARRIVNDWKKNTPALVGLDQASAGFVKRAYLGTPESKKEHRKAVEQFLLKDRIPNRLLTFCGPSLEFEKRLVSRGCTSIISVESNPILYERAILSLENYERSGEELTDHVTPCVKNDHIRVLNSDLLDLVSLPQSHPLFPWISTIYLGWDGVWLDFCGQLSPKMLDLLEKVTLYIHKNALVAITILACRDIVKVKTDEERAEIVRQAMNLTSYEIHRYSSGPGNPMLTIMGTKG